MNFLDDSSDPSSLFLSKWIDQEIHFKNLYNFSKNQELQNCQNSPEHYQVKGEGVHKVQGAGVYKVQRQLSEKMRYNAKNDIKLISYNGNPCILLSYTSIMF